MLLEKRQEGMKQILIKENMDGILSRVRLRLVSVCLMLILRN